MKTDDFDYYLPEELIAQTPLEKRSNSRLMVMDKITGEIEHKHFYDIIDYLNEGDALVINDTKVLPARIIGIKEENNKPFLNKPVLKEEIKNSNEEESKEPLTMKPKFTNPNQDIDSVEILWGENKWN